MAYGVGPVEQQQFRTTGVEGVTVLRADAALLSDQSFVDANCDCLRRRPAHSCEERNSYS